MLDRMSIIGNDDKCRLLFSIPAEDLTMGERLRAPYKNYEVNQHKILEAYKVLQDEEGITLPSFDQLAEKSGLSTRTVQRHFNKLDFGYICKRERIHTPDVVEAIRNSAKDGKARAQKLYAQIMEGYIEKKDHKETIVGDLNVNANVEGELKVNIQRGVIRTKEDLATLQGVASLYKNAKAAEAAPGADAQGEETKQTDEEIFDELTKAALESDADINIENLIVFK